MQSILMPSFEQSLSRVIDVGALVIEPSSPKAGVRTDVIENFRKDQDLSVVLLHGWIE